MNGRVGTRGRGIPALAALAGLVAAVFLWWAAPAEGCTTFCMRREGRILFGKNYDWHVAGGMLLVNKRGVRKEASPTREATPHAWTSRYGSVTFNQYGREFPSGGLNEAGLVVELMWLEGSRYPEGDGRGSLGCLQWIQYQLDTAANVAGVLASDGRVRIDSPTPLHYLVADRTGAVATVEFLDGRLVAHTGTELPVAALANTAYRRSLDHLRRLRSEGRSAPGGGSSLARFARAAERVEAFRGEAGDGAVAYAFRTLDEVAQGPATQWSIVYELDAMRVHYRTALNPAVRSLSLAGLDFGCRAPVLAVDLHDGPAGDAERLLHPLAAEENLRLVRTSIRQTRFMKDAPEHVIRDHAAYPDSTRCAR